MSTRDAQLRTLRKSIKADRTRALDAALVLAGRNDPGSAADVEFALSRIADLDKRLAGLPKPKATATVREPGIYDRGSAFDFVRDLVATVSPVPVRGVAPSAALERLQRHQAHEEQRATRAIATRTAALRARGIEVRTAADGIQSRALSTFSASAGSFAPPAWLVDEFASVARAASPLRELLPSIPLPPDCMSLVIPRFDAAAGIIPLGQENTVPTDEYTPTPSTDDLTHGVATFAAVAPISQQLFDRSAIAQVAQRDLAEAYAAALDQQLLAGTGLNGQMLGLLNVSGATTVTWTNGTPTPTGLAGQVGQLAATFANTRKRPPSFTIMRPARYFWAASQPDGSTNTPEQRTGTGLPAPVADWGPVGPVAGQPVILDANIPTNLGAGTNQDVVLAVRAADMLLLEDEPRFTAQVGTSGGGQSLTVFLVAHVYAAAILDRYPSGVGVLTGTGLAVPAGW